MKRKTSVALLVGTRKGGFILKGDERRKNWELKGPFFLGNVVHHLVWDPRNKRTLLMAARTGHLGPTVFRSLDFGKSWTESQRPPAFPKVPEGEKGMVVNHTFWLSPAHSEEPEVWYAGTSPQGLFRSEDGGKTWNGVAGFNNHPMREKWTGNEEIPNGPVLHSITVDPRDKNHIYIGMSLGGVFESTDGGLDWKPLNSGSVADFLPVPDPEYGQDPHCLRLHSLMPDRLYQQNHCGIYKMDRPEGKWIRIGNNMPKKIGDIGFPLVLHPRDPNTLWVFPMDGTTVWPRTSPDGKPACYISRNGGKKWMRQDRGMPPNHAWWTVKRQAMTGDARDPVGIYFGTTSGEVWGSSNEGETWRCLFRNLPEIYAVESAEIP